MLTMRQAPGPYPWQVTVAAVALVAVVLFAALFAVLAAEHITGREDT